MSDILIKVNQVGLNLDWPIAGQNNSSSVFRTNNAAILAGLTQATAELTRIQKTRFTFAGDAAGQSASIGSAVVAGTADPAMEVNFTLANVLSNAGTFNTNNGDYAFTFDAKGRLVTAVPIQHQIEWATGHAKDATVAIQGDDMGTGSGAVIFPVFRFDGNGRLVGSSTRTINFGLQNHALTTNAMLVGKTGKSAELLAPASSKPHQLIFNGSTVIWQEIIADTDDGNTIANVIGGEGIKTGVAGDAVTVALDLASLIAIDDLAVDDHFIIQDTSDSHAKRVPFSELAGKLVKVKNDTAPELGAPLNTLGQVIYTSTGTLGLQSAVSSPKTRLTLSETGLALIGSEGAPVSIDAPMVSVNATTLQVASPTVSVATTNATIGAKKIAVTSDEVTIASPNTAVTGDSIRLESPALSLNGTRMPATRGAAGQVLTMGLTAAEWRNPESYANPLQRTYFVTPTGSDDDGNGSMARPYLTINKALGEIPNNNNNLWTIVLMGGTYDESLFIQNKRKIAIESLFSTQQTRILGALQLDFGVDEFYMNNIVWDYTSKGDAPASPWLLLYGLARGKITNCPVIRSDATATAIELYGQTTGKIEILDCEVKGQIRSELDLSEGGELIIENLHDKLDKNLPIVSTDVERTLTLGDVGRYVRVNVSADNTLQVPDQSEVPFRIGATVRISQAGTGRTSVVPKTNATINTPNGYVLRKRFSSAILTYVGQDIWDLSGDLDESIEITPITRTDSDAVTADSDQITVDNG